MVKPQQPQVIEQNTEKQKSTEKKSRFLNTSRKNFKIKTSWKCFFFTSCEMLCRVQCSGMNKNMRSLATLALKLFLIQTCREKNLLPKSSSVSKLHQD
jgi:cytochrome oxidase Cu insertion factor (SCO1/SenC/PrrC family)